ncbi:MAG TPA: adenylate/guanylate cyclase domain-containing protein [Candidatus Limnocylindria bacterium]|nr:adenylate/guanylate cyclase domain-containing protein [Candidatus Limnocylindria bacterium]
MPEERKLVTVLFADIVGSTALGQDHDPEVVRAALGRAFGAMREVLVTHGGTVEKFIGDAVMAVFGVPRAHDDDADRAVRSAFAMRARVAELNRTARLRFELRVGVNTGEVVAGTGGGEPVLVTGAPVNAGSRLQAGATPGEILVGALTRQLTAGGVQYGERRMVEAKGIGPLEAWTALDLLSTVPEQHRGVERLAAPLIGRDRELRLLMEAVEQVRASGVPALVTIYGPAGSGKSRLTSEFIKGVQGARVRVGRCLPYGEGITFYPLQLILNAECGIDLGDDRATALAKLDHAVTEVCADPDEIRSITNRVSTLVGLTQAEDVLASVPESDLADELRWGVRRLFELRARSEPLVLVFEDIHWAEPRLIQLIEYLAEWSRAPLVLLCLARPDFRDGHPTFGGSAANATTLTLGPLGPDDARELITALLAVDALPESLRAEIVTRAEGNPLYVEEFLRTLIETGRIAQRDGHWVATGDLTRLEVPPTLIGLISARLDRVSPEVKAVLQRASLVGRLFSTAGLEAIGGQPVNAALLREAVQRDLLSEADERAPGSGRVYRFRHVLIRDVAYATVPKGERARLHDNYSRWLETSLGDRKDEIAEIVAFHAEQAFLLGHELELANADALGERALTLLLAAASRTRRRSDPVAARKLFERAAAVSDRFPADAVSRATAHGFAGWYRANQDPRSPEADTAFTAAHAIAAVPGPSEVLLELIMIRAFRELQDDRAAAANDSYDEVLRIARASGDRALIGSALVARAQGWSLQGDLDRSNAALVEARQHLAATGATHALFRCFELLVGNTSTRGEFSESVRYQAERRAALPTPPSKLQQAVTARHKTMIAYEVGDHTNALREAEAALAAAREAGVPQTIGSCLWWLGATCADFGDPARARGALEEAIAIFEGRSRGALADIHGHFARACVRLGDFVAAREHLAAAQQQVLPNDFDGASTTGVARAELADAVGDLASADAAWRETLNVLASSGFTARIAWTELGYGSFLVRRGRDAEAREQLTSARARYHDPLAYRRVEQIDALLAKASTSASSA